MAVGISLGEFTHVIASLNGTSVTDALSIQHGIGNFFESLGRATTEDLQKHKHITKDTVKAGKLLDAEAHIVIPDNLCSLQIITLPVLTEKEILSAIELQADEFIPYPIEKASYDYQVLTIDKKTNTMSILLLVALKELLNSIEEFVLEIGLFPVSLESVSTSLIKLLFQKNFPIDDDVILLLAVGDSATQVSLLSRKQSVVLMSYTLGIGSGFFVRGIQNYRTASYAEAMQAFVNIKKEDSELIQLVHTLFSEFQKEVAKVILTSQDKLGIKPSKMVIYGEASNALEILSQTSQAEMPPIYQLTLSALIEKKFFTASKKEIAQRNDALPTLSSCL